MSKGIEQKPIGMKSYTNAHTHILNEKNEHKKFYSNMHKTQEKSKEKFLITKRKNEEHMAYGMACLNRAAVVVVGLLPTIIFYYARLKLKCKRKVALMHAMNI